MKEDSSMWNKNHQKIGKRFVSTLTASALAGSQVLTVMPMNVTAADTDQTETGQIRINYGDANGDKRVDFLDPGAIVDYLIDKSKEIDTVAADVDMDGEVTLHDAEVILQHYHDLTVPLPNEDNLDWVYYSDPAKYEVINENMSWSEAEEYCKSKGGHLAAITDYNEQQTINTIIAAQAEKRNAYWIGTYTNADNEVCMDTAEYFDSTNWLNNQTFQPAPNQSAFLYGKEASENAETSRFGKWDLADENNLEGELAEQPFGFILEKDDKEVCEYMSWNDSSSLPTKGKYKLECDVDAPELTAYLEGKLQLDLNGHTVNISNISVGSELILRDSSEDKSGTINATDSHALISLYNSGRFKLYGGTLNGTSSSRYPTIELHTSSKFYMYGGNVVSNNYNVINIEYNSEAYLEGGTIRRTGEADLYSNNCAVLCSSSSSATIYVKGTNIISEVGPAIVSYAPKSNIYISGGKVTSESDYAVDGTIMDNIYLSGDVDVNGKAGGFHITKNGVLNITEDIKSLKTSIVAENEGVVTNGFANLKDCKDFNDVCPVLNGKAELDENGEINVKSVKGYQVFKTGLSWEDAKSYCESLGGHLVDINSEAEQVYVQKLIRSSALNKNCYWIGMHKNIDDKFEWVTKSPAVYTNWNPGAPNNSDGNQDAVIIYGMNYPNYDNIIGKWDDLSSSGVWSNDKFFGLDNIGFICEWNSIHDKAEEPDPNAITTAVTTAVTTTSAVTTTTAAATTTVAVTGGPASGEHYDCGDLDQYASPVKPLVDIDIVRVNYGEPAGNATRTVNISVSGADKKYANTGLYVKFDERLQLLKTDDGNVAVLGDAGKSLGETSATLKDNNTLFLQTADAQNNGEDGVLWTLNFQLPADSRMGDMFKIDVYYSKSDYPSYFTNAEKDADGRLMDAWTFTYGINQGYIIVDDDGTVTTTAATPISTTAYSKTTTSTTTASDTTTTTTSETTTTTATTTTASATENSTNTTTVEETTTTEGTTTGTTPPTKSKYVIIDEKMSWYEAEAYCEDNYNGHLATITSKEEQEYILNLTHQTNHNAFWIGGQRADSSQPFHWITDEPFEYTNWNLGEPNYAYEHFIEMYSSGTWNNEPDTSRFPFICEYDDDTKVPSQKPLKIEGELKVTPMTKEEVKAAGIDLNDDENFNSFKYTIEADFNAAGVVIEKSVVFSPSGTQLANKVVLNITEPDHGNNTGTGGSGGTSSYVINATSPTYIPSIGAFVIRQETVEEEMYMIIYGKSKWLKEFYDVQLIVVNKDTHTLKDCTTSLNIPDGLTLVKGDQNQELGDLAPNEIKTSQWYLRGDKEGDYDLSALLTGNSGGEEFDYTFHSKETLHVYSYSALKMSVKLPRYSYYNKDYPVEIALTNTSDKPIYGLENVITGVKQGSSATLIRTDNDVVTQTDTRNDVIFDIQKNITSISVDELMPGETAVIKLNIKDLWKSIWEQCIDAERFDANEERLMALLSRNPRMLGTYWFRTIYESAFSELPTEHILKMVSVNFENSEASIPYEIIIVEPDTEPNGVVRRIRTNAAYNHLREIFYGPQTPTNAYEAFRNTYIFEADTSMTRDDVDDFMAYINDRLTMTRNEAIVDVLNDMFFIVKPKANITAKVKVYPAGTYRTDAKFNSFTSLKKAETPAFEITDINGTEPDADGYITVTEETVIKLKANGAGKEGILAVEYSDGTKEEINVRSVEEHECSSTSGYILVDAPKNGQPGLAVQKCDTCDNITDTASINKDATAMFSNSTTFATYADIRMAVEDAAKSGEKGELSLFGNIEVTADVTIPDYVDVLIAPDTKITLAKGCKLIAKGKVTDFSGYNYDLSGNGPIVTTTAAATTETSTKTTSATTTTSNKTAASTTAISTSTSADTSSSTTAVTSEKAEETKLFASVTKMNEMAAKDYELKNGSAPANTITKDNFDGTYSIILSDEKGNVLDTYIIDTTTGKGKNAKGEEVDLPQTGNNSAKTATAAAIAVMFTLAGAFAMAESGVIRRKKDE